MSATIPLVAPVRFSGGGLSMQSTIGRIGSTGLFVRSRLSPKQGAKMELAVWLPGTPRPLEIEGIVGSPPAEAGKDTGFWVTFGKLPPESASLIDVLLQSRHAAGSGRPRRAPPPAAESPPLAADERPREPRQPAPAHDGRAYPRVEARLRVGWTSSRDFLTAWSENISRGGIFIATDDPPALREVVELSVEIPDGKPPAKTHAEVVHCVTAGQARESGGVAGVGLQFLDADDDFRERLDACLAAFRE